MHPPAGFQAFMQAELVDRLAALVGRRIANVRYWDGGPTYDGLPWEERGSGFDVCDGLELDLDDGAQLSIQAHGGGLAAFSKSVLDLDPYYGTKGVVWDVSTRSRWAPLLGLPIVDACVYAATIPLEVELTFEGGHVAYLAAAAPDVRPGSNFVIAFDDPTARDLAIGHFGPGQPIHHPGRAPALSRQPEQASGLEPNLGGRRAGS
jgi:hypothetical protein